MNKELKSCPFCGGKATAISFTDDNIRRTEVKIICNSCRVEVSCPFENRENTIEFMYKKWNNRV